MEVIKLVKLDNNDEDDRYWTWFKDIFFGKNLPFIGIRNNFINEGIRNGFKEIMNWLTEFTTEFINPNMFDEGNELIITVNTPGIPKKDLKIKTDKKSIIIIINKDGREIKRKIRLPVEIIPEKSYSKYKDGQLKIHLFKKNSTSDIEIN
ncbi:MAG: Hsp20/alpha crystallin family protein [Candidatus Helarchaeota archaeon]